MQYFVRFFQVVQQQTMGEVGN